MNNSSRDDLSEMHGYVKGYKGLSMEEEINYGKRKDSLKVELKKLLLRLNNARCDKRSALLKKVESIEQEGKRIAEKVIEKNMNLVFYLTNNYHNGHPYLSKTDLFSEGQYKLFLSWEKWNYKYGVKFSAFAGTNITRSFIYLNRSYFKERPFFSISLDFLISDEDSPAMYEIIEDEKQTQQCEQFISKDSVNFFLKYLSVLNSKERRIIEERFGLNGYNSRTLRDMGKARKISHERIRQIEAEAIRKIRSEIKKDGLINEC